MKAIKKDRHFTYYIQELNYRIMYTILGTAFFFFTTYNYKQGIIFIILPQGLSHFITANLTEIFFIYLQLSFLVSITFAGFILIVHIYLFLKPGLYRYEASFIQKTLIIASLLYIFTYTFVFPTFIKVFLDIFLGYSTNFMPISLTFEPRLNDYLKHIYQINQIVIFGLPCFILVSVFQRYTKIYFWVNYRGLAYITAFSIAAFITPPDILSQTFVGAPLVIFYEIQLLLWSISKRYHKFLLIRQPIKASQYPDRNKKQSQSKRQETFPP